MSAWVEKLFETNIPAKTIETRAYRAEKKLTSNEDNDATDNNHLENQENQDCAHGGARENAGRPQKYPKPEFSNAMDMAGKRNRLTMI